MILMFERVKIFHALGYAATVIGKGMIRESKV
jgi:hypothetical protein